jgi:CRISPR/Cas system-associated exonuclease Cas4 (RecB family)
MTMPSACSSSRRLPRASTVTSTPPVNKPEATAEPFTPAPMIKILGLSDKKISEDNFNDLNYFVKFIDVDLERCDDGVLFANSQNSVHINREIVIYLGMDSTWTKRISDLNYIDKKEEEKKNLDKFQILLNQGTQRYYFSHAVTNGEMTIPCHYFNILVNRSIKDFDAKEFGKVSPSLIRPKQTIFPKNETSKRAAIRIEEISQSRLNTFYSCPRKFAYNELITSPETPALQRGQILHCFAEFAFDYSDFCEKHFGKILEKLLAEFESFRRDKESDADRSIFEIAMRQILDFVKSVQGERRKYTKKALSRNFLYKEFRKTKLYDNTEFFFKNIAPGIRGRVDLAINGKIFDYKISAEKSAGNYVNSSVMSILRKKKSAEANFQTPMYFIYLLKEYAQAVDHEFTYLFPIGNRSKIIIEGSAAMSSSVIKYVPQDIIEYLAGEEFYEKVCGKSKAAQRLGAVKWNELVIEFAEKIKAEDDVCEDVKNRFRKIITEEMDLGPSDFNRKNFDTFEKNDIVPVGKAFVKVRTPRSQPGILFRDDIEQVKEYISKVLEEIDLFLETDFPYRPAFDKRKVCSQCDFLGICTGNKLWEGSGEAIEENGSEETENRS